MCPPAVVAGLTIAGGALQVYQQEQTFRAQEEAEEMRHKVEMERAERNASMERAVLEQQALEESSAIQQDRQALALEALRERGSKLAIGAESGLGGVSKIRDFLATNINEATQASRINVNENNAILRNQMEQRGIDTNRQDRIVSSRMRVNEAKSRKTGALDYLGVGVSGASAGFQTYLATK